MTEYRTKTFKSGNSLAIRLPKALGFREGEDVVGILHDDDSLSFWRAGDSAKVLDRLYGTFSPEFMADGRGDIDQDDRNWSRTPHDQAA